MLAQHRCRSAAAAAVSQRDDGGRNEQVLRIGIVISLAIMRGAFQSYWID